MSADFVRDASHVFSNNTRNSRLVQCEGASIMRISDASSLCATENPFGAYTVTLNGASISVRPRNWRTKYSSLPPTAPGTHHSMFTAMLCCDALIQRPLRRMQPPSIEQFCSTLLVTRVAIHVAKDLRDVRWHCECLLECFQRCVGPQVQQRHQQLLQ